MQTIQSQIKHFKEKILKKGYKNTNQREEIAEHIFKQTKHFTVDDIVHGLYKKNKKVSTATVYRVIHLLIDLKLIRKNNLDKGNSFYENIHNIPKHYHLICEDCDNIIEFQEEKIEKIHANICQKNGLEFTKEEVIIYGKCIQKNCKNK